MLRKGQILINYLLGKGYKKKQIEQVIFYMKDEEFDKILSSKLQVSSSARSDNSSSKKDCNNINTNVRFTKKEEVVCLRCNQIICRPK